MRNIDACLYVRPSDRTTLERLVADGKTPQKIVARARIVLLSGCGFGTNSIQREARVSKPTVWRWQKAYMDGGVERLLKDRGKGARAGKKPISAEVRLAIVKRTAQEKPRLGSPSIRASSCTSHQHRRPGSTWSSGCSPKSPASKSAAAYSRASPNSRLPSRPGSPSATPNRSPSSGPPKPISSSRRMHVPSARWKKTSRRVLNE